MPLNRHALKEGKRDEGGGGSHSHKLGAHCWDQTGVEDGLLPACLRERWREVKILRSASSTAIFSRMLALQVSEAFSLSIAYYFCFPLAKN